jgi:hypothetical protein
MFDDLVASRGRRADRIMRLGAMLGLGACLLALVGVARAIRPLEQANRAYWIPAGPACRPVSRPALVAMGLPLDQSLSSRGCACPESLEERSVARSRNRGA